MENRFDALAKALAGDLTRRGVLGRLGAGLLGAVVGPLGAATAEAKHKPKKPKKLCHDFCHGLKKKQKKQCRQACLACGGPEDLCGTPSAFFCCESPLTCCDNVCIDTLEDPAHCGACDEICPAGSTCENGECTPVCSPGETVCESAPGGCCGVGQECCEGQCCDSGQTCNCGQCGTPCPVGTEPCCLDGVFGGCCPEHACCNGSCCQSGTCSAEGCTNPCDPLEPCFTAEGELLRCCPEGTVCGPGGTCGGLCAEAFSPFSTCGGGEGPPCCEGLACCDDVCCPPAACCTGICCQPDQQCVNGECVTTGACPTGEAQCGTICCPTGKCCFSNVCCVLSESAVNVTGVAYCDPSSTPFSNVCTTVCTPPYIHCPSEGNILVTGCETNPLTDRFNCGNCGVVCPSGVCDTQHCTCEINANCPLGQECLDELCFPLPLPPP